jgi:molybdopterin synthase sulfur carrier subunit
MTIRIFGPLEDITGTPALNIEGIGDTLQLRHHLEESYPDLQNRKFVIAVDNRVVNGSIELNENSEVALLPPFSGG